MATWWSSDPRARGHALQITAARTGRQHLGRVAHAFGVEGVNQRAGRPALDGTLDLAGAFAALVWHRRHARNGTTRYAALRAWLGLSAVAVIDVSEGAHPLQEPVFKA